MYMYGPMEIKAYSTPRSPPHTLPSILCLDEPTTGLDAHTSYSLLLTLSRLATRHNAHRTVILSIHQPRSDAFGLFDQLVLLGGGRVVYSGPRARCLEYFASLGSPEDVLRHQKEAEVNGDSEEREGGEERMGNCVAEAPRR